MFKHWLRVRVVEEITASFNESCFPIWQISLACVSWIPWLWFVGHIRSQCFTSESYQYELGFVFLLAVFLFCSMYRSESRTSLLKYISFWFWIKKKNGSCESLLGRIGLLLPVFWIRVFSPCPLPLANCWTLRVSCSMIFVPSFPQ